MHGTKLALFKIWSTAVHYFFDSGNSVSKRIFDKNVVFNGLMDRYEGNERHYHNKNHLWYCFDNMEGTARKPFHMAMAIFYHDAVMDFNNPEVSEKESALYMIKCLQDIMDIDSIYIIRELILATKEDCVVKGTDDLSHDCRMIRDVDRSIWGADYETYNNYAYNIRREYWMYDEKTFCQGRMDFLLKIVRGSGDIYETGPYEEEYGRQAFSNLVREVNNLDSRLCRLG